MLEMDLQVPMAKVKCMVEQGLKTAAAAPAVPGSMLAPRSSKGASRAVAAATGSSSSSSKSSMSNNASQSAACAVAVWCGKRFQLQLEFSSSRKLAVVLLLLPSLATAPAPSQLHSNADLIETQQLQAEQQKAVLQQLAAVQCSLCAVRFGVQEVCRKADKARSLVAGKGRRWEDFFGLGQVYSWEQVRAGLARQHLGVGAGELHIRAKITRVW
jgi:hypothetical protein